VPIGCTYDGDGRVAHPYSAPLPILFGCRILRFLKGAGFDLRILRFAFSGTDLGSWSGVQAVSPRAFGAKI
jgi:hypothetical protein